MIKNTKEKMQELSEQYLAFWQETLRLKDWKITISVRRDPEEFDRFGSMKHSVNFQEGLLEVLDPEKIPPDWIGSRDLEVTILHELLHTRFIYCIPRRKNNPHEEMAIETTAKALVALRRGISPDEL